MSIIQIKKCNHCGKEARGDTQIEQYDTGFEEISIKFGSGYGATRSWNYKIQETNLTLCEECLKKIGIVKIDKTITPEPASIETQLYDIIAEMVADVHNNDRM